MIDFHSETDFYLNDEKSHKEWITDIIVGEGFQVGEILYIFCDDEFLHKLNVEFLSHDTLTDILSFDYRLGHELNGEIFISVERVRENAVEYGVGFLSELRRVMIHGILHFLGFKDSSATEQEIMRKKEEECLQRFPDLSS